jgi:pentatricopeptide repeat protein
MKNVFRKHIPKVESAIQSDPTNASLWRIWAWMARSSPEYNWATFITSSEPFDLRVTGRITSPPEDVCIWIADMFRQKQDWASVVKFAKQAKSFMHDTSNAGIGIEWMPGVMTAFSSYGDPIEGYPEKSSYLPMLEALLRLGNIEEANAVYDEMTQRRRAVASAASDAAKVARSVGMEDLAKIWEQGQQTEKIPLLPFGYQDSFFYVFADNESDFFKQFTALNRQMDPNLTLHYRFDAQWTEYETLGWKKDDGERWGLFSPNSTKILAQGSTIPDKDEMQDIFKANNIISPIAFFRAYLAEKGNTPGIELLLGYRIINRALWVAGTLDENSLHEAARYLRSALDSPDVLFNLPEINISPLKPIQALHSLAKQYMDNIESLLERKPTSDLLWRHWTYWWPFEDAKRPIEPLVDRIKYSPLSPAQSSLPYFVMDSYYQECKKSGNWPKVIGLLKAIWDREISRNSAKDEAEKKDPATSIRERNFPRLGDLVGIPLIEAYLNDGKARYADEVFNEWLDSGGKFEDISTIVQLAKEKGHEGIAKGWEEKVKK